MFSVHGVMQAGFRLSGGTGLVWLARDSEKLWP
jgi:hypothetical protein